MKVYIYNYLTEEIDEEFSINTLSDLRKYSGFSPNIIFEDGETIEYSFHDLPYLGFNVKKGDK